MTVAIPERASRHLKLLSAISAVFVVFIHATTPKFDPALGWESLIGQFQGLLSHNIFHVALAVFFLNAAFFLCHGMEKGADIWPRLKRRGMTLVLPYLAWSGFWTVLGSFFDILPERSFSGILLTWVITPLPGQ